MRSAFFWILAAAGLVLFAGAGPSMAVEAQYVGAAKCKMCHRKDDIGNQYGKWQESKHAKAFEALKSEKAAQIAKEKGLAKPAYESDECLKCHVTGHGKPASAFAKAPLKAEDGVQCESCHGPGSKYKKKSVMMDHAKAVAAGLWEPGKDEKICTACHNAESPTWDAAKGFDYEARKKAIAHPIPAEYRKKLEGGE